MTIAPASARCPSHSIAAVSAPGARIINEHRRLLLEWVQPHRKRLGPRPPEVTDSQGPDIGRSIHRGGITDGSRLRPWPTPTATTSSSAYALATFPNHELSTPTIGRPPSPSFPNGRSTPPWRALLLWATPPRHPQIGSPTLWSCSSAPSRPSHAASSLAIGSAAAQLPAQAPPSLFLRMGH
jgi:hypothetical protein